jgi:hypothetical protein
MTFIRDRAPSHSLVQALQILLYNILDSPRLTGSTPAAPMQITIRYTGGKPGARKKLSKLLSQAGYVIQTDAAMGGKASSSTHEKRTAHSQRQQRTAVTILTERPLAGGSPPSALRSPAVSLRTLRESAGKTQAEIARRTGMSQPELSRLESRKDHLISTLRKYVRALGGEIEVVASIGGRRALLRDV